MRQLINSRVLLLSIALLSNVSALAAELTVNTNFDHFGTVPSTCSLREAIEAANRNQNFGGCVGVGAFGNDRITLPSDIYTLTRTGLDDATNDRDDLDINDAALRISGAGASSTIIEQCEACQGRVLHVLAGSLNLTDVTVRRGFVPNGRAGGGLRSEPATAVQFTNVTLGLNIADGNGGGILNRGNMILDASVVDNNRTLNAEDGGGGIFNDLGATLSLRGSLVQRNRTEGRGVDGSGAGIFNLGTLELDNSIVSSNVIDLSNNVVPVGLNGDGGGIFTSGQLTVLRSTINNNIANGSNAIGGGIACVGGENDRLVVVSQSVIQGNSAVENPDLRLDFTRGGGIGRCRNLRLIDSIVDGNQADEGGGLGLVNGEIRNTTISANTAQRDGGGLHADNSGMPLNLVNVTVVNNVGGGIYAAAIDIRSSSIIANTSSSPGAGVFSVIGVRVANTVIAGNSQTGSGDTDDCGGNFAISGDYNLIQTGTGCITALTGGAHDRFSLSAQLGPLTGISAPMAGASNAQVQMLVRAPLEASPLLDGGNPDGCRDVTGALIPTDQRGLLRRVDGPDADSDAECDIGAVEQQSLDFIFRNGFEN